MRYKRVVLKLSGAAVSGSLETGLDPEALEHIADEILDMGPGPGRHGGEVVVQGDIDAVIACEDSATGQYFRERDERDFELADDPLDDRPSIAVEGATLHNLKNIDVRFPLGAVTVVTGVSGAGKSTLVRDLLEDSVRRRFRGVAKLPKGVRRVRGIDELELLREVDQLPIGRTPRSTPATYVGFWKRIREIFQQRSALFIDLFWNAKLDCDEQVSSLASADSAFIFRYAPL